MEQPGEGFFTTEAGQFIAGAHRYISAAKTLRYSDDWKTKPALLLTPVLHLLSHGMELLLKYPLLRSGLTQAEVRNKYGHDLQELWLVEANANLRRDILHAAIIAWENAENSGQWPDDFSLDPQEVVVKAVSDLARLHGKESGFALRYTLETATLAPRPAFLIDAFGDVAERTFMNPGLS